MTGLDGHRVYLDWNATAPLRPEARAAMCAAMDQVGNPSSVHAEGRAAKRIVETARGQVAELVGCDPSEVIFTSGATEAIAIWFHGVDTAICPPTEHDAVFDQVASKASHVLSRVAPDGRIVPASLVFDANGTSALQTANSETGVLQGVADLPVVFSDMTQSVGKTADRFDALDLRGAAISSHKLGGPQGAGALIAKASRDLYSWASEGGGQELGRRSGTENVIGIAGFGAAAAAAGREREAGVWDRVEKLRNRLEETLAAAAPETIFFGQQSPRLPNTSCFAVPGWKGETQVMQMDLAGFAVSAGSACSSGKVNRASRVLTAMGHDETTASSAIRVSMGPTTTEAEVMAFARIWIEQYTRRKSRAA
ncbi:MAG: aminotransferase class V-fold PLP-dependent enzyme [Pseudomonadota bacterium]